jgi:WhiB family transcriptional regulator, redox-sensing transcriptional regulator
VPRSKPDVPEMLAIRSWMEGAACRGEDPRMFDTVKKNQHTVITEANADAKDICVSCCPVMMSCLRHAVQYGIKDGIWGGLTEEERDDWEFQMIVGPEVLAACG